METLFDLHGANFLVGKYRLAMAVVDIWGRTEVEEEEALRVFLTDGRGVGVNSTQFA